MGSFGKKQVSGGSKSAQKTALRLLEADQDLPPEIGKRDLLLVNRSANQQLPRGEVLYVFPVPSGLAVKRVEVGLKQDFMLAGTGISEEPEPMKITRSLVGSSLISRVEERSGNKPLSNDSISFAVFISFRRRFGPRVSPANFSIGIPDACDSLSASVSLSTLHSRIQE